MRVLNALQMKKGAKADSKDYPSTASLTQPVQFLPAKKKDDDWAAWNLDWLENQGMMQLRNNARKILKNYKLAKGIIDKTGPNISSFAIRISFVTSVKIVGLIKYPLFIPLGNSGPPAARVAPSSIPL